MKKYLLLLISAFAIAQTAPSRLPGLIITANQPTVTSTPNLTTTEANGLQGKISPVNLPLSNATATALETYTENSSGALSGFLLTDNGNGTVNISSGVALLRSIDQETGLLSKYTIPAATNLALTDNANNFVLANYNGGTPSLTVTTDPATINTTTNTLVWLIARVGNKIDRVYVGEQNVDSNGKLRRRFLNSEPFLRSQGAALSFANRNISVSGGLFYLGLTPHTTPAITTFTNVYNNASVWTRQTAQTQVNNTQYNVNGVLTTMNNGRFRVDYVYLLVNSPSQVYTVMGGAQYNNIAEARLAPLPNTLPVELQRLGVLVGRLIIGKDAAAITEVSSAYDVRFNASTVINHNDTGGIQGGAVGDYQHVTTAEKNTYSSKFNTPTGLTTNYLPKWNGSGFGNSQVFDNGTNVLIGTTTDNGVDKVQVNGSASFNGGVVGNSFNTNSSIRDLANFFTSNNQSGKGYASLFLGKSLAFNEMMELGYVYDYTTPTNSFLHFTPFGSAEGGVYKFGLNGNFSTSGTITASPATAANQVVVKSQLDAAARPYKVYTALLSQSGTNAPTATVLENTLGGTVVWSRTGTGTYRATLTGVFLANKTFCMIANGTSFQSGGIRSDDNFILVNSSDSSGALQDGRFFETSIEIRVYL